MAKRMPWVWLGILAVGVGPGMAFAAASEVDILLDKLVQKGVLSQTDAGDIRKEIADTSAPRTQQLAKEVVPKWAQSITISGDMRLRSEHFCSREHWWCNVISHLFLSLCR